MTIEQILIFVTPIVVYGITWLVNNWIVKLPGAVIVAVVIPVLSLAAAWIVTLIVPGQQFWIQVAINVAAVFVNEVIRQLKQINKSPI